MVLCYDLDGWDDWMAGRSKKEGIYVCIQLIYFIVWQKLTKYYKAIVCIPIFKNPYKKKNNGFM